MSGTANQPLNEQQENPNTTQPDSQTETSQQTENQETQTSNTDVLSLMQETLRETHQRAQAAEAEKLQMQQRIWELEQQRNQPVVQQQEEVPTDFFQDPKKVLAAEIAKQVAPLNDFTKKLQRQEAYNNLKAQFMMHPQYGPALQQIGAYVDQVMANQDPSPQNMVNAIQSVIGQLILQNPHLVAQPQPVQQQQPQRQQVVTPPHLRPSGAPTPSNNAGNPASYEERAKTHPWTENERRLARENNMTMAQWLEFLEKPARI